LRSRLATAAQPGLESPNNTFVRTLLNIHEGNVDNTIHSIKNMNINNQNKNTLVNLVSQHTHNIQVNIPHHHNNRQGVPRPPPPPGPRPPPRNVNSNVQSRIDYFNENLPEGWRKVTTQNGRNTYRTYSGDEKILTEQSNWNIHIHPLAKVGTKYVNRQFKNNRNRVLQVPMIGSGDSYYDMLVNLKRRQNQFKNNAQRMRNRLANMEQRKIQRERNAATKIQSLARGKRNRNIARTTKTERVNYIEKVRVLVGMFLQGLDEKHDLYNNSGNFKQKNISYFSGLLGSKMKSSKNILLEGIKLENRNGNELTLKLNNVLENGRNFIAGNTTSNATFREAQELDEDIQILNLNDVKHLLYTSEKQNEISNYIQFELY